jgi:hypothetical protein
MGFHQRCDVRAELLNAEHLGIPFQTMAFSTRAPLTMM